MHVNLTRSVRTHPDTAPHKLTYPAAAALLAAGAVFVTAALAAAGLQTSGDPGLWDQILRRYVDENGMVAYRTLAADGRTELDRYIAQLSEANPAALPLPEQLAFWINAYNAAIISGILQGYSPETALSRARFFRWYSLPIAGKNRTPNEIEHDILRRQFNDPRIHFAIVCGARSCPTLRREAYRGDRLDPQLEDQARRFINDPSKNHLDPTRGPIALSSIFHWFESDFVAAKGSIGNVVAQYADTSQEAKKLRSHRNQFEFIDYDWGLNAQEGQRLR